MCDAFVSGNPGKEEKMKLYEIDNLTFAYPDIASERDDVYLKPVLKDIGLSIERAALSLSQVVPEVGRRHCSDS